MGTLLLMVGCGIAYIIAYNTYGRFLGRKIFRLRKDAPVPSHEMNDGVDYVPTAKGVIFGHHFTSIAGTGPIVGPAIGIIWGWLPAVLWIMVGSIFMGAVHDFGSLIVSMRNEGKSISEIASRYINPRVRFLFFAVVFLALLIVIAIFGMVIAIVFAQFPSSVIPVWFQIPIAMGLGYAVYKRGSSIMQSTIVAVIGMYATIAIGAVVESRWPGLCTITDIGGVPATGVWTVILLMYAWVASTLPVTTLLQPRDYVNAWQLFIMMGCLVVGVFASAFGGGLEVVAPMTSTPLLNDAGGETVSMWPMMFVTIACGAISGFHSLVASGTSTKQVSNEEDSLFVGYGSMLVEGFLAILVIICVASGIGMAYKTGGGELLTGSAAWGEHYSSWQAAAGLGSKLDAVVIGAANMMGTLGIPEVVGVTLMGVFIASFAGTTLDTSVRIQRYVVAELGHDLRLEILTNRWVGTTVAVVSAACLAFATGADGKGALSLWPMFGASNQLLAGLALLVVTMYLKKQGGLKYVFAGVPCVVMLSLTSWAMVVNEIGFYKAAVAGVDGKWLLVVIGGIVFALAVWMMIETVMVFCRASVQQGSTGKD